MDFPGRRGSEPDLNCEFSGPAGVRGENLHYGFSRPAGFRGRIWIVDLPSRRGSGSGFGLWICRAGGGSGPDFIWISVVRHKLY